MCVMSPINAVRTVMKDKGITQQKLALDMGYNDRAIVCNRLHKKDLRLSSFLQMMEAMGYRVSVQPRDLLRTEDEIIVSYSDLGM